MAKQQSKRKTTTKAKTTKPKKQKAPVVEQLIMDGVQPPVLEEVVETTQVEKTSNPTVSKNGRRVKQARILTKEELGIREKRVPKKHKKIKFDDVPRYNVDAKHGLKTEQVEKRIAQGLTNIIENKNVKTYKNIFFSNIFTFFNMLCFLVAGALIAVGALSNLIFMVIITCQHDNWNCAGN